MLRAIRQRPDSANLRFWRDPDGPEVDWVIAGGERLVPIEAKWADAPSERDIRHLRVFLEEYSKAHEGFVVCRAPRRFKLASRVTALPWQEIPELVAMAQS